MKKSGAIHKVLPGVRSVIVVAQNYWQGDRIGTPWKSRLQAAAGKIARYAWGEDYHEVMLPKLEQLSVSWRTRWRKCYVDTGPILERDHAAEAGIGWHGKSTMLIDPQLGTWFFLAEILTTLNYLRMNRRPAAEGASLYHRLPDWCDHRESPARCRCISYLTIELKGSIPLALRPLVDHYGCDDCDACPWNASRRSHGSQPERRSECLCANIWHSMMPSSAPFFAVRRSNGSPGIFAKRLCRSRKRRKPR